MAGSVVVQQNRTERPTRHGGAACVQPTPVITPSVVECMGRTTSVSFSEANGDVLVGGDVSPPQRWNEPLSSFVGYAAGGAAAAGIVSYPHKKTVGFVEGPTYGIWLAGSNNAGGIHRRTVGAALWTLVSTAFYGEVQDGGSTSPRRTKSRTILIDTTRVFVACERTGSPTNGIAKSADSGATFAAWEFSATRNFTAMVKSPQYAAIYAAADGRVGSAADGVFLLTGLTSGSATMTRLDTVGSGAPTLADVRDICIVREGTTETIFVAVGNLAGSDSDRGVWRCRIVGDPTGGGFNASSACTWTHIQTPGTADRVNCVVAVD